MIGTAISTGKATLADLSTVLGLEDLHDIIEVIAIDSYNARILAARREQD